MEIDKLSIGIETTAKKAMNNAKRAVGVLRRHLVRFMLHTSLSSVAQKNCGVLSRVPLTIWKS